MESVPRMKQRTGIAPTITIVEFRTVIQRCAEDEDLSQGRKEWKDGEATVQTGFIFRWQSDQQEVP